MMIRYLPTLIVALAFGYCVWWIMDLRADNAKLTVERDRLQGQLVTCGARLSNIMKDRESDDEIDRIPDDDLRNVPADWLLPPAAD